MSPAARSRSLPPLGQILRDSAREVKSAIVHTPAAPTISSEQDLKDYLWKAFGIKIPEVKVCANHVAPWEAFRTAYFALRSVIVIKGSRGLAGKTFTLAALGMSEAVLLGADVKVLGGSGGQSKRIHQAMARMWAQPGAPRNLLKGEPGVTTTKFSAGNEIEALTASQTSVRGPHPQRLLMDEVDEMDWKIFEAATGQTMEARGIARQTVISSTHQHANGTFTEVLKLAAQKGWPIYEWCWRETLQPHGWLSATEVEGKRGDMTESMWNTEVELQEPSSEGRAIVSEAVEAMFDRDLGETDSKIGEDEVFEAPEIGASYATGGDWGKSMHFSAIPTLRTDTVPARFVAFYRDRKKPYHLMVPKFDERLKDYPGAGCHDAHGVGAVIAEMIHHQTEGYTQWQGAPRIELFSSYISAIERGRIKAPRSESWYKAHLYVTNDDLYGNGHPPDEVIGGALAWKASGLGKASTVKRLTWGRSD